jgi:hypothetical protein
VLVATISLMLHPKTGTTFLFGCRLRDFGSARGNVKLDLLLEGIKGTPTFENDRLKVISDVVASELA